MVFESMERAGALSIELTSAGGAFFARSDEDAGTATDR
jgi:hypothetical protein